ncbi:MOSC domain-containing protein [Fodinisporobacter ferrooxydans]|uniref:MOSC domain-containing protein n=1 Tax=Fodinisporobacter ferrooxydans TaxID=2901836 RepID=A0ABY4CW45_9BACL|nr:MOSC domain-containing protein [Alicyclobacillaceae bacterium MYW30-H2]
MQIKSINVGVPAPMVYADQEIATGIFKQSVGAKAVFLDLINIAGDRQADLVNHGGKDKAVCLYPYDHYPYWEKRLGRKLPFASFGENLTAADITEESVCIGDVYQLGDAIVQISQPRQPCYKLATRFQIPDMVDQIRMNGYSGFYMRVLKPGMISIEKGINIMEKHPEGITVAFTNHIMFHDRFNREALLQLIHLDVLAESWKKTFRERLESL